MIIVESRPQRATDSRAFRTMFEDRKSVFVDLLGWDVPVLAGRFEVDEFDDGRATYVIVADSSGNHLGSARLLPTTGRHILGSLFPALCAGEPPAGPDIFEITRFCLSRRQKARQRRRTRDLLVGALARHALESGIRTFAWTCAAAFNRRSGLDIRERPPGPDAGSIHKRGSHAPALSTALVRA